MKPKEKLPRVGRPVKIPDANALRNFGPLILLVDDTLAILKSSGAPFTKPSLSEAQRRDLIARHRPLPSQKCWGEAEALLILKCLHAPLLLASNENAPRELRTVPLAFARLFAEAPNAMIKALPKIRRLLLKRARTPKQAVAFDYALRRDARFWTEKSDVLASELGQMLRMPITSKVIEHARDMVRERSNNFPRTRK